MTIDEAIKHCLEVAEQNEAMAWSVGNRLIGSPIAKYQNECEQCAADHRRLAEWLTDYKKSQEELAEAKRLLKLAIEDLERCDWCSLCKYNDDVTCVSAVDNCFVWKHADEALKLMGGKENDT